MIGFEYTYLTLSEILNIIKIVSGYSMVELFILIILMFFVGIFIYYLFPLLYTYNEFKNKENHKKKTKLLIKQIAIQKDINDEIEKELNIK